jgi:hypothetical protein
VPDNLVQFVVDQLVANGVMAPEIAAQAVAAVQQASNQAPDTVNIGDQVAADLEKDLNHYLTVVATEYYPDTDRAAFVIGLMGGIAKKIYNCPLRRRPVSESASLKDLIVDAGVTDLANAPRVTHEITYMPHEIRQLQEAGVFADVSLGQPQYMENEVDRAIAEVQGYDPSAIRPEDRPHTIWETAVWLNTSLDEPDEDGHRIPKPYKVTQDRDTRRVYAISRNWDEGEKEDGGRLTPRQEWVLYPFVPALGWYPIGLMHILGNSTMALTAAWRLNLDAMMFSVFPGFLYADVLGKQITNIFRVPPGGGVPIQTGGRPIGDMISKLPYQGPQPTGLQLIQSITDTVTGLGGSASVPTGEGQQNVPVGTILASIVEQTKPVGAVYKRLHTAQAQEFRLLKARIKENTKGFFRSMGSAMSRKWEEAEFIAALNDASLVPAADPNTPSKLHRIMQAFAVFQMAIQAPTVFGPKAVAVAEWVLRSMGVSAPQAFLPTQQEYEAAMAAQQQAGGAQKPNDPANMVKAQASMITAQARQAETQTRMGLLQAQTQKTGAEAGNVGTEQAMRAREALVESNDRAADRQSQMAIDMTREETARLKLAHEAHNNAAQMAHDREMGTAQLAQTAQEGEANRQHAAGLAAQKQAEPAAPGLGG